MKRFLFALFVAFISYASFAQNSHTCPVCHGKGKKVERCDNHKCHNGAIYCETCNYRGVVHKSCYTCNGSGQTSKTVNKTCEYCNGERYKRMSKETPCSCRGGKRPVTQNGRTVYVDCSRCSGTGVLISYYNAACRYCGGRGVRGTETVYNTCHSCNGNGKISSECSTCGGKGCYPCSRCGGYANIERTCSRCHGSGQIYTE